MTSKNINMKARLYHELSLSDEEGLAYHSMTFSIFIFMLWSATSCGIGFHEDGPPTK